MLIVGLGEKPDTRGYALGREVFAHVVDRLNLVDALTVISSTANSGSVQLRTDAAFNPWDVPSGPGSIPPSTRVAGNGERESHSEEGRDTR